MLLGVGAKEGEIATNILAGQLVWEKFGKKVAIDLVPQTGELFANSHAGRRTRSEGLGDGEHPGRTRWREGGREVRGEKGQTEAGILLHVENEKVKDVLFSKIGGPGAVFEQAGQTVTNVQKDEEALEVNTVV